MLQEHLWHGQRTSSRLPQSPRFKVPVGLVTVNLTYISSCNRQDYYYNLDSDCIIFFHESIFHESLVWILDVKFRYSSRARV